MKIAICAVPDPMSAGPSRLRNVRTSGSSRGISNVGRIPWRLQSQTTSATCAAPDTATPIAAPWLADGNANAHHTPKIVNRLNRTGAAADEANLWCALSTPENSVTAVVAARYGNVMRVSVTASGPYSVPVPNSSAIRLMNGCVHNSAAINTAIWTTTSAERMRPATIAARRSPSLASVAVYVGTNAALNAPSAKIERKWLGRRSARKNTSASTPFPSTAARTMSRRKPVTRDRSVKPETTPRRRTNAPGRSLAESPRTARPKPEATVRVY